MLRVLFLAANPKRYDELDLEGEVRAIRRRLESATLGDQFHIEARKAVSREALLDLINEGGGWDVVHFSGHGSEDDEIILEDERGLSAPVTSEALEKLLRLMEDRTRLVVLNACHAVTQAEVVTRVVECAIGMSEEVKDRTAILFASVLYRAIGFGKSVQQAFDAGCLGIEFADLAQEHVPQLRHRDDVDPSHSFLLSDSEGAGRADAWSRYAPNAPQLKADQKWNTFLSYRSVNRIWALNLYDTLELRGVPDLLRSVHPPRRRPARREARGRTRSKRDGHPGVVRGQ